MNTCLYYLQKDYKGMIQKLLLSLSTGKRGTLWKERDEVLVVREEMNGEIRKHKRKQYMNRSIDKYNFKKIRVRTRLKRNEWDGDESLE